jgi:hypothetical protein
MPRPSAGEALYPNLKNRSAPSPSQQPRPTSDLAAALYPKLSPEPLKPRTALHVQRPAFGAGMVITANALAERRR